MTVNIGVTGAFHMSYFVYDYRLGILLPKLDKPFENYDKSTQEEIWLKWEQIRGTIPDRIKELEKQINDKQTQLGEEANFDITCKLNTEIAELASIINDLWIWYRSS